MLPSLVSAVTGGRSAAQPQQVLQELKRYGSLLSRPSIASTLEGEKEQLAKHVSGAS